MTTLVDELNEAAGITDHAVNGTPDPSQESIYVPIDEIRVDGTTQLDLFDLGGKKPASASIRLTGGKVALLDGKAFRKGDTIQFSGTAVITAVTQQDKRDSATGIAVSCEQQHRAQITDLTVTPAT
jgi:hypothetical protein